MTDTTPSTTRPAPDQRRIVVGVDGSDASRGALRRAAVEAAAHGGRLEVVHAWDFLDQPGPTFDPHYGEQAARTRIVGFLEDTLDPDQVANADIRLVNDHAARALVDASAGAWVTVVGARGLGGFKEMVLGSVSQYVVHHSKCPVLVVR